MDIVNEGRDHAHPIKHIDTLTMSDRFMDMLKQFILSDRSLMLVETATVFRILIYFFVRINQNVTMPISSFCCGLLEFWLSCTLELAVLILANAFEPIIFFTTFLIAQCEFFFIHAWNKIIWHDGKCLHCSGEMGRVHTVQRHTVQYWKYILDGFQVTRVPFQILDTWSGHHRRHTN